MTWLQRNFQNRDSIESNKNEMTDLRFRYKNGELSDYLIFKLLIKIFLYLILVI